MHANGSTSLICRIIKWTAITMAGIFLFYWGKSYAYQWRRYDAVGGEYIFLLLPLWWKLIAGTARDWRRAWAAARKHEKVGDDGG